MTPFPAKIQYLVCCALMALLSACGSSQPNSSEIQAYIENYQIAHDYVVQSMTYEVSPRTDGDSGSIQVSGKLELREPLYEEDLGNKEFRKSVAKMLRRNRFSEREISHEIYDRAIRATTRVPGSENEYYTFLNERHVPGFAINFSADLIYTKGNSGFLIDGPVRHPKLQGSQIIKFTNPVVDSSELVEKAVKNVLAAQTTYRDKMKASSAALSRLWNNDHGLVVWNRKQPYLGSENLTAEERAQLEQFSDWRGVFRITNIKPVQFRTPHASNFFELGSYSTEGVATCLRQTGFIDELSFAKADYDRYCEFGAQYPVRIEISSTLDETNEFLSTVEFEVNGASSGEIVYAGRYFEQERNELGRYSDQIRAVIMGQPFELKHHARPQLEILQDEAGVAEMVKLVYSQPTDIIAAEFVAPENDSLESRVGSTSIEIKPAVVSSGGLESKMSIADEEVLSDGANASDSQATSGSSPLTKKELVKGIQTELKRLKIYTSTIDGIAGKQTLWSMRYAHQALKLGDTPKTSQAFLEALIATPDGAISPPPEPYKAVAKKAEEKKKGTIAGNAVRGAGKAISNAGKWIGGLFRSKDDEEKKQAD